MARSASSNVIVQVGKGIIPRDIERRKQARDKVELAYSIQSRLQPPNQIADELGPTSGFKLWQLLELCKSGTFLLLHA